MDASSVILSLPAKGGGGVAIDYKALPYLRYGNKASEVFLQQHCPCAVGSVLNPLATTSYL